MSEKKVLGKVWKAATKTCSARTSDKTELRNRSQQTRVGPLPPPVPGRGASQGHGRTVSVEKKQTKKLNKTTKLPAAKIPVWPLPNFQKSQPEHFPMSSTDVTAIVSKSAANLPFDDCRPSVQSDSQNGTMAPPRNPPKTIASHCPKFHFPRTCRLLLELLTPLESENYLLHPCAGFYLPWSATLWPRSHYDLPPPRRPTPAKSLIGH